MLRHHCINLAKSDKSGGLCHSYITHMCPKSALGACSQSLFRCFQFSALSDRTASSISTPDNLPKKNFTAFLSISIFLRQKIYCCYWAFSSSCTQHSLFWTNHFVKHFTKCIQMMGNMGVFEPLMRDELDLVIQGLPGLCPWLLLCGSAMQPECRISLLGSLDPAVLMKLT